MVTVDWGAAEPAAVQVYTQMLRMIRQGVYLPGDRLPSIRRVAREAGLSQAVAAQAFRMLAAAGWIDTRVRGRAVVVHRLPAGDGFPSALPGEAWTGGASPQPSGSAALAEAAYLLGLDSEYCAGAGPSAAPVLPCGDHPAARRGRRRRATLRQRRLLGLRLRAAVRAALLSGMSPGELEALIRSAVLWENHLFATGGTAPSEDGAATGPSGAADPAAGRGEAPPIPPFLMGKLRQRGAAPRP